MYTLSWVEATNLGGFQGLIAAGGISGSTRSGRGRDSVPHLQIGRRHVPYLDGTAVFGNVSPATAIEAVREGFIRYASGEWTMPAKVYLPSPPHGDFRAMPASGTGFAILKWVSSFPSNGKGGAPTVSAIVCVNDKETGEVVALVEGSAVTALRTGASAAVATLALAPSDAQTVGIIGSGLNGGWAARCLKQAGYLDGVCTDVHQASAARLAAELGWRSGSREDALQCDVVTTITPGLTPVAYGPDLRPGMHLNGLGADGPGKAEFDPEALDGCTIFCDEWEQASHGGEIASRVAVGTVTREDVVDLGDVLTGRRLGRTSPSEITFFDSTGLAVQDLAIVDALLREAGIA